MPKTIRSAGQLALIQLLVDERKRAGLTQADLALRLRCHQSLVARIESGERRIDVVELVILSRAIGVLPEDLTKRVAVEVSDDERL
ncbi:helix-turn-helix domain-containing protein [Thioclava atlantica]|uniref:helix-turn-helix domain-containing protein n=1 Tax=Thioclava atlantica TaxID=1317124 RepID=UPI00056DC28E|nr:helix-turn-helix transcriptional regulator [Thioclava atlantica]